MEVVFPLKNIVGLSIFVFGRSKERKNGAMNVVYIAVFSYLERLGHNIHI